ncbi:MAG TPA: M1 family aminopeptidase [Thermoanaerobaculia bacterium]|nr:M1 family aminopeptidase [Thermoanaerobaculia bacterium]
MTRGVTTTCLALAIVFPIPALAADTSLHRDPVAAWEQLKKLEFGDAIPLPEGGLRLSRDTAEWTLESGTIRLMRSLPDGTSTGLVFEGTGRFRMSIPDPVELVQLRRFMRKPDLDSIDVRITSLYARAAGDLAALGELAPAEPPFTTPPLARRRSDHWVADRQFDVDARVLSSILNGDREYLRIDFRTDAFDWLTWEHDRDRHEEITLDRFESGYPEIWLSIDRPEDRDPEGRPSPDGRPSIDIEHIDVRADLTRFGSGSSAGIAQERPIEGHFEIEQRITVLREGLTAIPMRLHPWAKEIVAETHDGARLAVVRDHLGGRSRHIDKRIFDRTMVVVLERPATLGETLRLRFRYELELTNFAHGDSWYPTAIERGDRYTARMELTTGRRHELFSMGRRESESELEGKKTSTWVVDKPVTMLTFVTAQRFQQEPVKIDGAPEVVSFGPGFGIGHKAKVRNVAVDVASSLRFFAELFDDELEDQTFYVTSIPARHGQSFEGFLHMSETTYRGSVTGASEMFRAHEVAHQWWGHRVGWKSYRDQWLSESFAEYSAMMYVEATMKGGAEHLREILMSYDGIVKGNLQGGFSRFNRPWLIEFNQSYHDRLGPISAGYRAGTRHMPLGYTIQSYCKGPLVIHMMRSILQRATRGDEVFIAILRDFLRTHGGSDASTKDLKTIVEKHAGSDWSWFFDQWIDGAEIPTVHWKHEVSPAPDGTYDLTLRLRQSGTSRPFTLPIPLRVDLGVGRVATFSVILDAPSAVFTQSLPSKPVGVVFNPDFAVLMHARRD